MDDRLTLIEQEKQKALQDSNNLYSNLQEQNQNLIIYIRHCLVASLQPPGPCLA